MRYFYDFEFTERGNDYPILPLSMGIVAEDGREAYWQFTNGFPAAMQSEWLRENVIPKLTHMKWDLGTTVQTCTSGHDSTRDIEHGWDKFSCPWISYGEMALELSLFLDTARYGEPEFWGYYADYDHVCYAQLFGAMIALPQGFPMWTRDIKQLASMLGDPKLPEQGESEHNALDDARWNKQAFEFLQAGIRKTSRKDLGMLLQLYTIDSHPSGTFTLPEGSSLKLTPRPQLVLPE